MMEVKDNFLYDLKIKITKTCTPLVFVLCHSHRFELYDEPYHICDLQENLGLTSLL